jgi:hypothetical protein
LACVESLLKSQSPITTPKEIGMLMQSIYFQTQELWFSLNNWIDHAFHVRNQTIFLYNSFNPRKLGCSRILKRTNFIVKLM